MEEASWKKLILHWVNISNLLEKPATFLDHTDLDAFYREYRKLMMRVTVEEMNIHDFLKVHYPSFKMHFLEGSEICSADYAYIYCLLLHYACVVCMDEHFQSICKSMTRSQQQAIVNLFERISEKDTVTRAILKNILRETAPHSPIEFMNMGSPIRTPLKTSPSTPSAKLLDERSRELISVKAQLETERYEKSFLEMRIKEAEEKFLKSNQQQRMYIGEIKQLKEKLMYGDEQNIPQNREKKDMISEKSHQKQIQKLEEKICALNIEVDTLTKNRGNLQQKNSLIEKELGSFREKFQEQLILNGNIRADLEEKTIIIADLERDNHELKLLINEIKPNNTDLNSTDSLDFSFNSSKSKIGESPENLAKTVIEVQLREKERENLELHTKMATKNEQVQKISQDLVSFLKKNCTEIVTDIPEIIPNNDDLEYVVYTFLNTTEKLLEKETEMKRTLLKAEVEQASLVATIACLNDQCAKMKQEMDVLEKKEKCVQEKFDDVSVKFSEKSKEFEKVSEELREVKCAVDKATREVYSLRSVNVSYEKIIKENETFEKEMTSEICHLKEKLSQMKTCVKQLEIEKGQVKKSLDVLQGKFTESERIIDEKQSNLEKYQSKTDEVMRENSVLTNQITDLKTHNKSLQETKDQINLEIIRLMEELKVAKGENDQLKLNIESLSFEKEELKAEVDNRICDMKNLTEINRISAEKLSSLEEFCEELKKKYADILKVAEENGGNLIKIQQEKEIIIEEKIAMGYQLKDCENEMHDLKNQIASFEAQEIEFSKKIDSLNAEIEVYKLDNRKIHLKKTELMKQTEMHKTEAIHLLKEIECHKLEIKTLTESVKEKEKLVEKTKISVEKTIEELQKEIGELKDKEKIQNIQLEKSEEEIKILTSKLSEDAIVKEEMVKNQKEELSSLQRALADTFKMNEELSEKLKNLEEVKMKIEKCLEVEISSRKVYEEKLEVIAKEKEYLGQKLLADEASKDQMKDDIECLEKDLADRKKHCSKLAAEMAEVKEESQRLNTQVCEQKIENTTLQERNKSLEQIQKDNNDHIGKLQKKLEKLQQDIVNFERITKDGDQKIEKLSAEIVEKESQIEKLTTSLEAREKDFEAIEEGLRKEITEEKVQIQVLQEEKGCLEKKLAEMQNLQENLLKIKASLIEKTSSNEALTEEINMLQSDLSSKNLKMSELAKKLEDLERSNELRNEEYTLEISKISAESEKKNAEINDLKSKLQENSAELVRMEEDRKTVNGKAKEFFEKQQDFEVKCTQYEERIKLLSESKTKAIDLLQKEITGLEKKNIDMNEKIKVLENCYAEKTKEFDDYVASNAEAQEEIVKLKEEIQSIECQNDEITQKLLDNDSEIQNLQHEIKKLLSNRHELENNLSHLKANYAVLEETMAEKDGEILNMRIELNKKTTEFSTESIKIANLLREVEKYKGLEVQVKKLEALEHKEKEINEKLVNENAILQAKLYKNRQTLEEKEKSWESEREVLKKTAAESEEKIYENKREMEGKLEKMKEKMKALCNVEIEKLRLRYERDAAMKIEKAEKLSKKLSQEIAILNSKQLDLVKENTNLKRMMGSASAMKQPVMPQMNLNMEDEEGEQFNNTYLKDMKSGAEQASFFGRESVTKEELDWRNSRQPPHLKSQYAAQYGIDNFEDDVTSIGETNVHDDSMSSLLYAGQRKKMSGTTSYKRPGPPTPSKNGGRLSLGGTGEVHPRQILKEINESTKQQTPSTLRAIFSRKSLARDENPTASPAARFRSIFRNKRTTNK
ncbi:myosin-2 heavy chain isoform X2 [Phlebotomus papatasi]|uniref:myosin-2 heavy chain isoform X2 n=1 Tax=Phlebotomus papatasi TaxID=29031 RepID=UPI0024844FDD|nr:myosin-2 heavy chain isoform X2 [Phlebotomus papatasi]